MAENKLNPPEADNARLHAVISGRVQGVGFRAYVESAATGLDLNGWVRNTPEGAVEVVIEGPRDTLARILNLLHHGPRTARVESVQEDWGLATGEFHYFSVRPTGYGR